MDQSLPAAAPALPPALLEPEALPPFAEEADEPDIPPPPANVVVP